MIPRSGFVNETSDRPLKRKMFTSTVNVGAIQERECEDPVSIFITENEIFESASCLYRKLFTHLQFVTAPCFNVALNSHY